MRASRTGPVPIKLQDDLVALGDQLLRFHSEIGERIELLSKSVKRGSRLIPLPMDDLVVVDHVGGYIVGQQIQLATGDCLEKPSIACLLDLITSNTPLASHRTEPQTGEVLSSDLLQ